ncbi:PGF-CTERM sorting domain-containing protein [Halorubrum sp. ASP1]|uniref:S8 family serine peptidase n=1 Tax=Halorubrum sp. ASP1 TaxID=2518114 RepID=UPI0010F43614|nr:S8 family serine peptidase [Halorubrum sp. ASP1]TKX60618.1 PGF-CTERM sorting domain-containing protein [Halorubrum sp. ASP1]
MRRNQVLAVVFAAILTFGIAGVGTAVATQPSSSLDAGPTLHNTNDDSNITSEGTELIGGQQLRNANQTGDNVTVAVIDAGFSGDPSTDTASHEPITDNVIEYNDVRGGGQSASDKTHGDDSAEVVTDVAPDAELVLYTADNTGDWTTIANDIQDRNTDPGRKDVDVVSMSLGSTQAPLDGSESHSQAINDAVDSGVIWVTSSGNTAGPNHYSADYKTGSYTKQHEFGSDTTRGNLTAIGTLGSTGTFSLEGTLHWNGDSAQDYEFEVDLYKKSQEGTYEKQQTISSLDPSTSRAPFSVGGLDASEDYAIGFNRTDSQSTSPTNLQLNAFIDSNARFTEHPTQEASLTAPATLSNTFTVGAAEVTGSLDTQELDSDSSRGPTVSGTPGVDIVGPTDVTTKTQIGIKNFGGTSAAAPHVAGTAAVVLSTFQQSEQPGTEPTVDAVQQRVKDRASQMGGTESQVGAGHVNAAAATIPQSPTGISSPTVVSSKNNSDVPVSVSLPAEPVDGEITVEAYVDGSKQASTTVTLENGKQQYDTTLDLTNANDGVVNLTAFVEDSSGIRSLDAGTLDTLTLDTERPEAEVDLKQDTINSTTGSVDVTIEFSQQMDTSTLPSLKIDVGGETVTPERSGSWTNDTHFTTQLSPVTSEERQTATVSVIDAADPIGNPVGSSTGGNIIVDTGLPEVTKLNAEKGLNETNITLTTDEELSGAEVQVTGPDSGLVTLSSNLTLNSSADDSYEYTGKYETTAPGDYTVTIKNVTDLAGNEGGNSQTSTATITDEDVGTISGAVKSSVTGKNISNVTLTATNAETSVTETIPVGSNGNFAETVPTGTYTLEATHNESNYNPNTTGASSILLETSEAQLSLDPKPASLSGSVATTYAESDPLAGAGVTVSNEKKTVTATLDSNNEFAVAEIQPGQYTVTVTPEDYTQYQTTVTLTPNSASSISGTVDPLPATVSGTITDNVTDSPATVATIKAANNSTGDIVNTTSVGGPSNTYALDVPVGNYTFIVTSPFHKDVQANSELAPNEELESDFTVSRVESYVGISSGTAPSEAETGNTVSIEATIINRGNNSTQGNISFTVGGNPIGTENTTMLATDESQLVQVEYSIPDDAGGTTKTVKAETANATETLGTISIPKDAPANPGGGGGGSGGAAPAPSPQPEPPANESSKAVSVSNKVADFGEEAPVNTIEYENEVSAEISVEAVDANEVEVPGAEKVVHAVSINSEKDASEDTDTVGINRTVTFRIPQEDTTTDQLAVVHESEGGWTQLNTTVESRETNYEVSATTDSFSRFAVIEADAEPAPNESDNKNGSDKADGTNETDEETPETNDSTEPEANGSQSAGGDETGSNNGGETGVTGSSDDETPGFGPVVALLALLAVAGIARYQR